MKLNKLYVAMAISSLSVSAIADDNITSRLADGKFSGEAFGGYWDRNIDFDNGSEIDSSDFTFDRVRLAYHAEVKDNVIFGAELELFPGTSSEAEADSTLSNSRFTDLYMQKIKGDMIKTFGRFKQTFDRESAVELSDALFSKSASLNLLDSNIQSGLGISSNEGIAYDRLLRGASRRIEGFELKGTNSSGLNYTVAIYKGGIDSTGGDSDRNFGYSGSVGWQGGSDGLLFGFTGGLFQEDGGEADPLGANITDSKLHGYRVGGNLVTGPVSANLYIADTEFESDVNGVSQNDMDNFTVGLHAAIDLGGTPRKFDNFNVRQGPNLSGDGWAYEGVLLFRLDSLEEDGVSGEIDVTTWGIGVNAYCSEYTKIYASYTNQELDASGGSADPDVSKFAVGLRFDF